jgi:hypothetical protein
MRKTEYREGIFKDIFKVRKKPTMTTIIHGRTEI